MNIKKTQETRAGARVVDLGRPSVYQEGTKFEIKHKSRCLRKKKRVHWGTRHVDWEGQAPLGTGSAGDCEGTDEGLRVEQPPTSKAAMINFAAYVGFAWSNGEEHSLWCLETA